MELSCLIAVANFQERFLASWKPMFMPASGSLKELSGGYRVIQGPDRGYVGRSFEKLFGGYRHIKGLSWLYCLRRSKGCGAPFSDPF